MKKISILMAGLMTIAASAFAAEHERVNRLQNNELNPILEYANAALIERTTFGDCGTVVAAKVTSKGENEAWDHVAQTVLAGEGIREPALTPEYKYVIEMSQAYDWMIGVGENERTRLENEDRAAAHRLEMRLRHAIVGKSKSDIQFYRAIAKGNRASAADLRMLVVVDVKTHDLVAFGTGRCK